MIDMNDYQYIRIAHYKYGHSIRKISKDTSKCRKTIRKILAGNEPSYSLQETRDKPVMSPYIEIIKGWLQEDKNAPPKQKHTARRIHDRLVEECQFQGSESTVRKTVRALKEEMNLIYHEAFVPSDPPKRHGAEMDWGEVRIELDGHLKKMYMFYMRAKYSGKIFVKLYPVMLQECFFNGHIEAFAYFGGVFGEIVYDNLKSAVKKVLKGSGRVEQSAFISFRSYYCFEAIFCNTRKGSEKGGVEGLVGYARRNYLTPVLKCKSLSEANNYMLDKCKTRDFDRTHGQQLSIGELFEKEKQQLLTIQQIPYNNYKLIETCVDKYMTVKVKNIRYSVPQRYVGKTVEVELGLYDVRITYKNQLIAEHDRQFQSNKWMLDPWHYLQLLTRKTRAFKESRVLTTMENNWHPVVKQIWEIQIKYHGETIGTKNFLEMLLYFQNKKYSEMVTVIELAIENKTTSKESIKMLYESLSEKEDKAEEAEIKHLAKISHFTIPAPDISKFNALMQGVEYG